MLTLQDLPLKVASAATGTSFRWALRVMYTALVAYAGYHYGSQAGAVEVAQTIATYAQTQQNAAQAYAQELTQAQARANRAEVGLAQKTNELETLQEQTNEALKSTTVGRPCFNTDTLRVLDRAPGLRVRLPAAARGAVGAPAAVATDTDLAGWVSTAGTQYETCRARIDALRAYYEGEKK